MINPEFQRHLWLQFSRHRLLAMPAVLALIFLVAAMGSNEGAANLGWVAVLLFIGIVWFWGLHNAAAAINDERQQQTWDQQRLSALSPWALSWGKLLGSTLFNWYGGGICLLVLLLVDLPQRPLATAKLALTLVLVGVLLHAAAMALGLHAIQSRGQQRGTLAWLLALPSLSLISILGETRSGWHLWWRLELSSQQLLLYSMLFLAPCAVFAVWRLMSNALQVRTLPWAWPLFAGLLTVYLAGFQPAASAHDIIGIGLLTAAAMTYGALFSEPNSIVLWQRVQARVQSGDWRRALQQLPLWPTTLALTLGFALLHSVSPPPATLATVGEDWLWQAASPLALSLLLLRDCGILLFFAFADNARRVATTSLLYLLVIDALLPALANAAGLDGLAALFLPLGRLHGLSAVAVAGLHAAIALALVRWRWRKNLSPQAAVAAA